MRTTHGRASGLEQRVAALEKRLDHYDSERSIIRTLHRYCHAIDYGPPEAWADCFTEDGAIEVQRRNGRGRRASGWEAAHRLHFHPHPSARDPP
ncbi:MAG: nuclear transport factor 2 family protein [Chloroflexi bacterium]|nr:nuclear transport factor 2 family protein [Chloroflexota bacterium]